MHDGPSHRVGSVAHAVGGESPAPASASASNSGRPTALWTVLTPRNIRSGACDAGASDSSLAGGLGGEGLGLGFAQFVNLES